MDLNQCKEQGFIRKTVPDKRLVRSLIEMSQLKLDFFERVRKIRNKINYYGKPIEFEEGKLLIDKMISYRTQLIENELFQYLEKKE